MSEYSLDELRQKIDAIDDTIHDLLMQRAEVVAHVASAKGISRKQLPIRPSREASMLRRLAARHKGPFPFEALARIWSEMIAAFTQIQADYSIAVFVDDDNQAMWDLARDQFGAQTPIIPISSTRDALDQVFEDKVGVAVLPAPTSENPYPWWTSLCVANAPRVISKLPFAGVGNLRGAPMEALAVARLPCEPTGNDRTLMVVETNDPLSRQALHDIIKKANLELKFTTSVQKHEPWMHLVEVDDFVKADDQRLALIVGHDVVQRVHVIGGYADILRDADFKDKNSR